MGNPGLAVGHPYDSKLTLLGATLLDDPKSSPLGHLRPKRPATSQLNTSFEALKSGNVHFGGRDVRVVPKI